jgi:predicted nucleic acid-binding protein
VIVLDASAAIAWLVQDQAATAVEERLFAAGQAIHAPCFIDVEVAQVMRKYVATQRATEYRAQEALRILLELPMMRHSHEDLLWRIWDLRGNLTAYDAAYVALAESLDATLLTCDAKLLTASGHYARVEVV